MSKSIYFDRYAARFDQLRDLLDDDGNLASLRKSWNDAFHEAVPVALSEYGKPILDAIKETGMTQEEIAEWLGVSNGTVSGWNRGRFTLEGLMRLMALAAQVGTAARLDPDTLGKATRWVVLYAMMKAMMFLRRLAGEPVCTELSELIYDFVERASHCDRLWDARIAGDDQKTQRIWASLFATEIAGGYNSRRIVEVVDEWCPAYQVVKEEFSKANDGGAKYVLATCRRTR